MQTIDPIHLKLVLQAVDLVPLEAALVTLVLITTKYVLGTTGLVYIQLFTCHPP